ncbi:MAG: hypothetical protein ABIH76_02045 [Candidatus Bathyarchaeota archaeon]
MVQSSNKNKKQAVTPRIAIRTAKSTSAARAFLSEFPKLNVTLDVWDSQTCSDVRGKCPFAYGDLPKKPLMVVKLIPVTAETGNSHPMLVSYIDVESGDVIKVEPVHWKLPNDPKLVKLLHVSETNNHNLDKK